MGIDVEPVTDKELAEERWRRLEGVTAAYSALVAAVARDEPREETLALRALLASTRTALRERGISD